MKSIKQLQLIPFLGILFSIMVSCAGNEEKTIEQDPCDAINADSFDSFLGVDYGTKELMLNGLLGRFTSGEYSPDSSSFIYHYDRVDRVPLRVWVNAGSGNVATIFMEVLSLKENFEIDVEQAAEEFNMSDCDVAWFGMSPEDVKARMGHPSEESYSDSGVLLLSYDSRDFLHTIAFKFYPEQDNRCSSISVNWFY